MLRKHFSVKSRHLDAVFASWSVTLLFASQADEDIAATLSKRQAKKRTCFAYGWVTIIFWMKIYETRAKLVIFYFDEG